jgi:hypothetical protein
MHCLKLQLWLKIFETTNWINDHDEFENLEFKVLELIFGEATCFVMARLNVLFAFCYNVLFRQFEWFLKLAQFFVDTQLLIGI